MRKFVYSTRAPAVPADERWKQLGTRAPTWGIGSYDSYKKYAEENGLEVLDAEQIGSQVHWLASDRRRGNKVWDAANRFNLENGIGYDQYTTITQRAAFYDWFASVCVGEQGHSVKWVMAASVVADQMSELDNPVVAWLLGSEVVAFGNEGNKRIFEDVFGRLSNLYEKGKDGQKMTGKAAETWDKVTLRREQFEVVDPLYRDQSECTIKILQNLAELSPSSLDIGLKDFTFKGNVMDPDDRYKHGMNNMVDYYKYKKRE